MAKRNLNIRENYQRYKELVEGPKKILTNKVLVEDVKPNHPSHLQKIDKVEHEILVEKLEFITEVVANNEKHFKFKLKAKDFDNAPFFRYDSDGSTHRNKIPGVPLEEQQITAPHFHKFSKDGVEIAYKTDTLNSPSEAEALNDINLGIKHFCNEANVRYGEDELPEVLIRPDEMPLNVIVEDPHLNINFPGI